MDFQKTKMLIVRGTKGEQTLEMVFTPRQARAGRRQVRRGRADRRDAQGRRVVARRPLAEAGRRARRVCLRDRQRRRARRCHPLAGALQPHVEEHEAGGRQEAAHDRRMARRLAQAVAREVAQEPLRRWSRPASRWSTPWSRSRSWPTARSPCSTRPCSRTCGSSSRRSTASGTSRPCRPSRSRSPPYRRRTLAKKAPPSADEPKKAPPAEAPKGK